MKKIINKIVGLEWFYTSLDGFPVFDLMQESKRDNGHGDKINYWSASGTVFYTQDEDLIKKAKQLSYDNDLDNTKEFLKEHHQYLRLLSDKTLPKIEVMNNKQHLAYHHLLETKHREDTFKNGYYGAAHLIEERKLLIFFQNRQPITEVYRQDINIKENYDKAYKVLKQAYLDKKIEPDTVIEGKAFAKLLPSLVQYHIEHMSKYQKNTVLLMQEFHEMLNSSYKHELSIITKNNNHTVVFNYPGNKIEIILPEKKKEPFKLTIENSYDEDNEFTLNLDQVLYYVNERISQSYVKNFVSNIKKSMI